MMRISTLIQLLSFCAFAQAMSSSLMADIKEAHLQSPLKTNKVKRAQEFIMFGNQQNRASTAFGNPKTEKRASSLDENGLVDDEEPVHSYDQPDDDRSIDSNQLATLEQERANYPHMLRDLYYYNLLFRNMDLGQGVPRESAYMDLAPLYGMVEDRPKRDTKNQKSNTKAKPTSMTKEKPSTQSNKKGDRMKRDSLSDLLALLRIMEAEKANKEFQDPRNYYHLYGDEMGPRDDGNDINMGPYDDDGGWYESPEPSHVARDRDGLWGSRPHKRFMVSKRRYDDVPLYGPDSYYNYMDGPQAHRRIFI